MNNMGVTHETRPSPANTENRPEYPRLSLGEKHIGKLGLKDLPAVGTAMKMEARVKVTGAMMVDGLDGKERMLHLDITHMKMAKGGEHHETDGETKGKKLYGGEKEK